MTACGSKKVNLYYECSGPLMKVFMEQRKGANLNLVKFDSQTFTNGEIKIVVVNQPLYVDQETDAAVKEAVNKLAVKINIDRTKFYRFSEKSQECHLENVIFISVIPYFDDPERRDEVQIYLDGLSLGNGREAMQLLRTKLSNIGTKNICLAVGPHTLDSQFPPPGTVNPFKEEIEELLNSTRKAGAKIVSF